MIKNASPTEIRLTAAVPCKESLAFLFDVALDHAVKTSHVDPLRGMQAEQGVGIFDRERIGENQTSSGTQKAG